MSGTRHGLFSDKNSNKYYVVKPSTYTITIDGFKVEPQIIQPTPKGARILAEHYNAKYKINMSILDHGETSIAGDKLLPRFELFHNQTLPSLLPLKDDLPVGVLLMHGSHHAVPIILSKENGKNYMMIFDTNAGPRKRGYYPIANLFPDFTILLNNGTRQADNGSCVTDGISILKDALRMKNLGSYLFAEKLISIDESEKHISPRGRPRQFFGTPLKQENFSIFMMPEELLKSAQISKYVTHAKADMEKVVTKNNQTLSERRARDTVTVSFNSKPLVDVGINGYLYKKSLKHADIIDAVMSPASRATSSSTTTTKRHHKHRSPSKLTR